MPYSTFVVRKVFADPSKGKIIGPEGEAIEIHANRNNIAIVDFPNDNGIKDHTITYFMSNATLTDATIAMQAYTVIQALNTQESNLAAITVGVEKTPEAPDPAVLALQQKQAAYMIAARDAMAKFRGIPEELAALADLKAAEAVK